MGNEAAEKTEEATSRRRTKERERGNISKSKDMESALVMVAGVALLAVFATQLGYTLGMKNIKISSVFKGNGVKDNSSKD